MDTKIYTIFNKITQKMRTVQQTQKGQTQLQRKHMQYVQQKQTKKQRKIKYTKPEISEQINRRNKCDILNPSNLNRKMYANYGDQFMSKGSKLALIILAGGYGCRADIDQDKPKQFQTIYLQDKNASYRMKKDKNQPQIKATTLFEILFQSIKGPLSRNKNITVYIVCSRKNSKQISDQVDKITAKSQMSFPIYICYQPETVILDWNGLQTIYLSKKQEKKLMYPNGIGTFLESKICYEDDDSYSLGQHMTKICNIEYAYCIGTSNKKQTGINPELLGLITRQNLSCVFQCSKPDAYRPDELPMVCLRKEEGYSPAWLVMDYRNYGELVKDQELRTYPVWMDNFVINTRVFNEQSEYNKSVLRYQFNYRLLKGVNNIQLNCLIPQVTISSTVMRNKQKCVGYLCPQGKFMKKKQDFTNSEFQAKSLSPSKMVKRQSL